MNTEMKYAIAFHPISAGREVHVEADELQGDKDAIHLYLETKLVFWAPIGGVAYVRQLKED